jgi:DNA-binding transcriptional LysR family regulator
MDLQDLSLFMVVARQGSFAAVARDRGIDPSSVSRSIAGLEASLGARLFQRTSRRMVLTEAGELYLARLPSVIEELERLRDEAASLRSGPVGTIRLTASVAFGHTCLLPLLPAFEASFPRLKLELLLTDSNLDLVADRIDLAIRLGPSVRADLIGVRLMPTRYRVVASPAYLTNRGGLTQPSDLADRQCLLLGLTDFRSRWVFRTAVGDKDVAVSGQFVISNPLALRAAAVAGLGPALLVDWLIEGDLRNGGLEDLFPDHEVTATTFDTAAWLLYPSRAYLPRKTRSVIDFLRANLSGHHRRVTS